MDQVFFRFNTVNQLHCRLEIKANHLLVHPLYNLLLTCLLQNRKAWKGLIQELGTFLRGK